MAADDEGTYMRVCEKSAAPHILTSTFALLLLAKILHPFTPTRYFAAEIIGNVLELEPRLWRRPRRMDKRQNDERVKQFRTGTGTGNGTSSARKGNRAGGYDQWDWTKMLAVTQDEKPSM